MRTDFSTTFVIGAVLCLTGCLFDTSADVPFDEAVDMGERRDMNDLGSPDLGDDTTDMEQPDLAAPDVGPLFPRESLPQGQACDQTQPVPPRYACNLVTQDCAYGEICTILLDVEEVITRCAAPMGTYDIQPGDACEPQGARQCVFGSACISGRCRRYCETDGAIGCNADEFCQTLDDRPGGRAPLEGFGVCLPACR